MIGNKARKLDYRLLDSLKDTIENLHDMSRGHVYRGALDRWKQTAAKYSADYAWPHRPDTGYPRGKWGDETTEEDLHDLFFITVAEMQMAGNEVVEEGEDADQVAAMGMSLALAAEKFEAEQPPALSGGGGAGGGGVILKLDAAFEPF